MKARKQNRKLFIAALITCALSLTLNFMGGGWISVVSDILIFLGLVGLVSVVVGDITRRISHHLLHREKYPLAETDEE